MSKRKWPKPTEKEGRYYCPFEGCDKSYAHKRGYREHYKKKHVTNHQEKDEKPKIPPRVQEKIVQIEEQENLIGSKKEEMELEELYQTLQTFGQQMEAMDIVQDEINVSAAAEFILLIGLSDLHMGNQGVDYAYIDRLLDFIANHPKVFCYVNGDLIDNWVRFSPQGGGWDEILPPKYQNKMAEYKLSQIQDSILFIIQGNHEYRSEKQGEESPLERIAKKMNIPYLGHGGRVNLKVNDILYKMHCRHKFRYNSSFNPSHSCVRLNDVLDAEAEIVAIG